MQPNAIEMHNLCKSYTQKKVTTQVLDGIDLVVPKGNYVTIMGPSGCGKSVITKIIAGIEGFDSGTLLVDGVDCAKKVPNEIKQRIGYTFQWHNLMEWRTVEQNLYLPLESFGWKKEEKWKEVAKENLEFVGLYEYRDVFPHELSGGMQQRVGIARAMMNDPQILLFDQPFGALDAITRKQIAQMLSVRVRKEGRSVLIVSSNIDEAIQYSDTIYFMSTKPGRIIQKTDVPFTFERRQEPGFLLEDDFLEFKRDCLQYITY